MKKFITQFIKGFMTILSGMRPFRQQPQEVKISNTQPSKIYRSIDFLPVWNFFKIIETSDKKYLYKVDDYEDLEVKNNLDTTWMDILDQFNAIKSDNESKEIERVQKKILTLETKMLIINGYITLLKCNPSKQEFYSEKLKKYGVTGKNTIGILDNEIRFAKSDLKRLSKSTSETKQSFEEKLDVITRERGVAIDAKKTSVKEWIAIEKNHNRIVTQKNKTNVGKNREI